MKYSTHKSKTAYLNISDGVVNGLVAAGIIFRSADVVQIDGRGTDKIFAHNLTEFVWEYLQKNKTLLTPSKE